MKLYTEQELKRIISKKYHNMIDWSSTMFCFNGDIELIDNGQVMQTLPSNLLGNIKNANWYLKKIQENKNIEW